MLTSSTHRSHRDPCSQFGLSQKIYNITSLSRMDDSDDDDNDDDPIPLSAFLLFLSPSSCSIFLSLSHTHSLSPTLTLTLTLSLTLSLTLPPTHSMSLSLSLPLSLSKTQNQPENPDGHVDDETRFRDFAVVVRGASVCLELLAVQTHAYGAATTILNCDPNNKHTDTKQHRPKSRDEQSA
eukprot:m.102735 g.102735  ORF g.102735 m.102735 type:complete len:181 (+) comp27429_c0_seq4:109-651(+)